MMPAPLNADTDTNSLLTTHASVYLYGCLREAHMYTHDVDGTEAFEAIFQREVSNLNINYQDTDWAACDPPVMCPKEIPCCD